MRIAVLTIAVLVGLFGGWWLVSAPPAAIMVGEGHDFAAPPASLDAITSSNDYISLNTERIALTLPAYDEVVLNAAESRAYVTAVDGWFWEVDLDAGVAARFVDAPMMPAGARIAPDNDRLIYFCASRLYGANYPASDRVGLYQLDVDAKAVTPLVLDVPQAPAPGGAAVVYLRDGGPRLRRGEVSAENSRPVAFCNDLDVSADGRRIYFTEPFAYDNPSMGGAGTYREAIALGRNGYIWRYDMDTDEVSLVAQNFTFPDGILVEDNPAGGVEDSLLVNETVKFKLVRIFTGGAKAGRHETVWENLPGMPDGLDRDGAGRIWVGIIKQRSPVIDWIHQNPWIKPLLLRLPYNLMPSGRATSFLALSPDGRQPLFYSEHDGSVLTEISVVIPGRAELYLATVGHDSKGLYSVPYPDGLTP